MNEKQKFVIVDSKGKQVECEPLFTFESEETKKQYVVYTDNTTDASGKIKVYASIYNITEKGKELLPIKTEKEWRIIETILDSIQEESQKSGAN